MKHVLSSMVLCLCMGIAAPVHAGELIVSAAASLTDAFTEIKTVFEKQHPGVGVAVNFAASGTLFRQMREGAPVDVFASADQLTMDKAVEAGLIDTASRKNFARNTVVLIVPHGKDSAIKNPAELAEKKIARIAVGNPASVPVGSYTKEALEHDSLWNALSEKYIFAETVRQVLDYVARGEVDAGFVYRTDAMKGKKNVDTVMTLGNHTPVEYPAALLSASKHNEDAAAFMALLLSPEGQAILAKYGFSPAE